MRKLLLFISVFVFVVSAKAQSNFEVLNQGTKYTTQQLEEAITNATMCGYFYKNERRKLVFEDGSIVELFSESETSNMEASCFIVKEEGVSDYNSVWQITDTGHLMRKIAMNIKK